MNSGLVGWGWILIKSLPLSPREKLGEPDLLREVAGLVPHLYLLRRLEHRLLPGACHACLPSVWAGQPAPWQSGLQPEAPGSCAARWTVQGKGGSANVSLASSPPGTIWDALAGKAGPGNGCLLCLWASLLRAHTPGALCPGKVSKHQGTKHPRGTSSLGPQGPYQAIISILITDICSAVTMPGLYARCFVYVVSFNLFHTHYCI